MDADHEADFGLEHVAEAGQDILTEEDIADRFFPEGLNADESGAEVKVRAEYVPLGRRDAPVAGQRTRAVKLGHRHQESDGLADAVLEHNAHLVAGPAPTLPRGVDVPAAAHAHVGGEDAVPGEMDQEPFAARFDPLDDPTGQGRVVVRAGEKRIVRAKASNGAAGEHAPERPGGAVDGIAFGHAGYCTSP